MQPASFLYGRSIVFTLTLIAATAFLVAYFTYSGVSSSHDGIGQDVMLRNNTEALLPNFDPTYELDFAVIGFPKTGKWILSLLYSDFSSHVSDNLQNDSSIMQLFVATIRHHIPPRSTGVTS